MGLREAISTIGLRIKLLILLGGITDDPCGPEEGGQISIRRLTINVDTIKDTAARREEMLQTMTVH